MEEKELNSIEKKIDELKNQIFLHKEILNLREAAAFLGVSAGHLYRLTSRKEIPHFKPGGKKIYFDRYQLVEWVRQNPVTPAAELDRAAAKYTTRKKAR